MKSSKKHRVDLHITSLSSKGNGRGLSPHPNGDPQLQPWTIEVPFTVPGDHVSVVTGSKRSGIHQARLEALLTPAPERIEPRCIHFGSCGGCRWQQMPYSWQLAYKTALIEKAFASLLTADVELHAIIPAEPWEYRNKMEFSFSSSGAGERFLGLNLAGGRGKAFNLTECHLVHSWHAKTLDAVRSWWVRNGELDAYHPHRNSGTLRTLILREGLRTGDRMVMLTVSGNADYPMHKNQIADFTKTIQSVATPSGAGALSIFLRIQQIAKRMPTMFYEMHLAGPETIQEELQIPIKSKACPDLLRFNISPSAFFQPNTFQAERLYARVLQLASISNESIVYDLYCGTATLGILAAQQAKQVIAVELSPEAVLDAKANAKLNGVENITIIGGAVGDVLGQPYEGRALPHPDIVLVDPPRVGLEPAAIQHLLSLKPNQIVYVSCNPISQAANLMDLIAGGYRLTTLQPVDQFPQTMHIENIAILAKI